MAEAEFSALPWRRVPATAATGLSSAEAARRRSAALPSAVNERSSRPVSEILRANILTRFNFILGTLLVVVLAVGPPQDAVFGIILVANALIGIGQELRAKMTLDRLAVLTAPLVRVIRDATPQEIKVADLVSGDLVELRPATSFSPTVLSGPALACRPMSRC